MNKKSFIEAKQSELNEWKKDLEIDVKVTDDNVLDKSRSVPNLYQKYLSIYIKETMILKKLRVDLDSFYGQAFRELLEGSRKLHKGEIEHYINSNDKYCQMKRDYDLQEQVCVFLEGSVKNVKDMSFNLKNYIELKVWLSGGR